MHTPLFPSFFHIKKWGARIGTMSIIAALGACSSLPQKEGYHGNNVITDITSNGQSTRVKQIVLHYTHLDNAKSLAVLSKEEVSAHYLVMDTDPAKIYFLVDERRSAWHAGISRWYDQPSLNATSIGIEIVNYGRDEEQGIDWRPYSEAQVTALIPLLKDLIARHKIDPKNVVGHSDIAPQRKQDPGPLFPWKRLAQEGIGRWYNEETMQKNYAQLEKKGIPPIAWFQTQLKRIGYDSPQTGLLDKETRNVIHAFQMHYRPSDYEGNADLETAAILMSL